MNTSYRVVYTQGGGQAYEHRLVWERHCGPIPANHHVHHKNGDPRDNRLENLELLSSNEHHRHHFTEQGATTEHKDRASKNIKGAWDAMPVLRLRCVVCQSEFEKRQHLTIGAAKYCGKQCSKKDYYKNVVRPKLVAAGKLKG